MSHLFFKTSCLFADTLYSWQETKPAPAAIKKKKCKITRHHIYSCLHSPQLWSDKSSQSNLFRKYHCQPPLFLTVHISSAVKRVMMSRAVIKENWCLSLNALVGCWCSVGRICTAAMVLSIMWKSGMCPDKLICGWAKSSGRFLHF